MKKLLLMAALTLTLSACDRDDDNNEPVVTTPTPSVESTPSATPEPTITATPTPEPTVAPTQPPATPTPTATPELPRAFCPNGVGPYEIITMSAFEEVNQLRMPPCKTTAFTVIAAPPGKSEVLLTQGQQPATPAQSTTEFYVSKTPGLVQNDGTPCYVKTVFDNYNNISVFTQPVPSRGWVNQATLGQNGCWAPASEGPWYVNVRWAYHVCNYGGCGFSMQWARGGW